MKTTNDLTQGSISKALIKLATPIIGMSFLQMAYNMLDMMWLGHVGSDAVAAVGTATFFTWLGVSVMLIAKVATEVGVSQRMGAKNYKEASLFTGNAISWMVILSIVYGVFSYFCAPWLIGFFKLDSAEIVHMAIRYLQIIALGAPFYYMNQPLTGIFTGAGNSTFPFKATTVGLVVNFLLDPLLIFGYGPIPGMGAEGAAIATVLSKMIVTLILVVTLKKNIINLPISKEDFTMKWEMTKEIFRVGTPVGLHSGLFACFAMIMARIISQWGDLPIAVQSVGAQIESVSWMTMEGLATALAAFTGQNYGAKKWDRVYKGFLVAVAFSVFLGLVVGAIFIFFGGQIFGLFINEAEAIRLGAIYFSILGLSQVFMCLEIGTSGAFYGLGKTNPPSFVGITFTGLRIPLALWLTSIPALGMTGVWWSISISSVVKGIVLFAWFMIFILFHPERDKSKLQKKRWIRFLPTRVRQQIMENQIDS
ncbi:MATE family efflux transporter [Halosquirtibacter xylanolyticus]|uniref:MATE family efflux transporter n=1 Tax=Halosquirtibacter xylanolyticus TaxID=3374599 RepID=UPI00374978F2|nr:MATE family efflux transporter [Prolixibacteraceae bacterium]